MIHPNVVQEVDKHHLPIEARFSRVYDLFKRMFATEAVSDYDLDCFAVAWLASGVENRSQFMKKEIVEVNSMLFHRHYYILWTQMLKQHQVGTKVTKETSESALPMMGNGINLGHQVDLEADLLIKPESLEPPKI